MTTGTPRRPSWLVAMMVLGGVAFGSGSVFFFVSKQLLHLSTAGSLIAAGASVLVVMGVAVPAAVIAMKHPPDELAEAPALAVLLELVRAGGRFAISAFLAFVAYGFFASGSLVVGSAAAVGAVLVASLTVRRMRMALGRR
ncbi:MAG TPA: hypothetical protein VIL20_19060 [Sandaracinaceae bacterium]